MPLQFCRDLREFVRAARNEHQVVMVAGEELGQFVSDAAGGAGDENSGHDFGSSFGVQRRGEENILTAKSAKKGREGRRERQAGWIEAEKSAGESARATLAISQICYACTNSTP
jgi:hypothetical protein